MALKRLLVVCCMLAFVASAAAQGTPAKGKKVDPVSGTWAGETNNSANLKLKYDGKKKVSGTVGTPRGPADIKTGTFNASTGALHLQGDTTGPDGSPVPYDIAGTIKDGKFEGTYQFGPSKGNFKMTRKATDAS